jgi:hypothetical protein
MRLPRAVNGVWAGLWSLSAIGILTDVWDWMVDRFLAPRNRS